MAVPLAPQLYSNIAELRTFIGQQDVRVDVLCYSIITDQNGGTYRWDSTSTVTDDGFLVIQATGVTTGRWLRVANSNTIKGSAVFNGTGLLSVFTYTFPIAMPFTPAQVQIQPTSQNAVSNWVTSKSSTGFSVQFITVPVLGTANITFDWLVIKQ